MISIRDAWRAWQDLRAAWDLWENRGDIPPEQLMIQALDIVDNWIANQETLDLVRQFVPFVGPWSSAWKDQNAVGLWDTTVDMLEILVPLTEGEIDDKFIEYARTYRDIGIAILARVIGGEGIEEAVYAEAAGVDDQGGVFGATGDLGDKAGNTAAIIAAIQVLIQVIRFIMDRRSN